MSFAGIRVDARRIVCPDHEAMLARHRSVNPILFPLTLLEAAFADERIQTEALAGLDALDPGDEGQPLPPEYVARLQAAVDGAGYLCEYLPRPIVSAAWAKAGGALERAN
jgi:hypothetical protein